MKTAKTFRLSEQAIKQLQTLKEKTGSNETAIVEIALALFEQAIIDRTIGGVPKGGFPDRGVTFGQDPNSLMEQAEVQELAKKYPQAEVTIPHHKKRKRRR